MDEKRGERKRILMLHQPGQGKSDIGKMLAGFGYQVTSVSDGSELFDVLKDDQRPQLMVMEVPCQGEDLFSFLERLRAEPLLENVPVIALMEKDELGTTVDVLDAGCDAFLLKPVDPRVLYQRIQELLEKTPRAYNRVLCRIVAEATSGQEMLSGEIVEIGEGGAGLLLDRKQVIKDILKLVFFLPQDSTGLIVGVEVIHVEKCGDQYLHGVRFIIIDGQAKEKIRQFVQEMTLTGEP